MTKDEELALDLALEALEAHAATRRAITRAAAEIGKATP